MSISTLGDLHRLPVARTFDGFHSVRASARAVVGKPERSAVKLQLRSLLSFYSDLGDRSRDAAHAVRLHAAFWMPLTWFIPPAVGLLGGGTHKAQGQRPH